MSYESSKSEDLVIVPILITFIFVPLLFIYWCLHSLFKHDGGPQIPAISHTRILTLDNFSNYCTRCGNTYRTDYNNQGPLCSSCFALEVNCKRCGERPPNPGYKWCQICFNTERNRQASVPNVPGIGDKKCYGCNRTCWEDPEFSDENSSSFRDFCGITCARKTYAKYGVIELRYEHEDYEFVVKNFTESWAQRKGPCPSVVAVFLIHSSSTFQRFEEYRDILRFNEYEFYYHGTKLGCDLLNNKSLCKNTGCSICQIASDGFDLNFAGSNVPFTRYGKALYFASNSSKCHDYTQGNGYRCMMYVKIAPGTKCLVTDKQTLKQLPPGCNSIFRKASAYGALNYDELCIYDAAACMPQYLIIYCHDGSKRILN